MISTSAEQATTRSPAPEDQTLSMAGADATPSRVAAAGTTCSAGPAATLSTGVAGETSFAAAAATMSSEGVRKTTSSSGISGNDEIVGGHGWDRLFGGTGNDFLKGGDGNDILVGGLGDDVMIGGRGVDHFVYLEHAGHDVIHEFDLARDVVDLRLLPEAIAFADLTIVDNHEESGVRIKHAALDGSIEIKGISASDLSASNFKMPDGQTRQDRDRRCLDRSAQRSKSERGGGRMQASS